MITRDEEGRGEQLLVMMTQKDKANALTDLGESKCVVRFRESGRELQGEAREECI